VKKRVQSLVKIMRKMMIRVVKTKRIVMKINHKTEVRWVKELCLHVSSMPVNSFLKNLDP
jgi:lysozyme family protein